MLEASVKSMMSSRVGAIEAPAGTGKTEQIARIAETVPGRWLVLTHTIAGRDAIRRRLSKRAVPTTKANVDTFAAWSYRWATAYPRSSHLPNVEARRRFDSWQKIQQSATQLVESGAVDSVLMASYDGILIDEYQDCSSSQHALACALSQRLRCYVFGDPLQAIFRFSKTDISVDWADTALSNFPLHGCLREPHRWNTAKKPELGYWLTHELRTSLAAGILDLNGAPASLEWVKCHSDETTNALAKHCQQARQRDGEVLAVIDSSTSVDHRTDLAKSIRGTIIESVAGTTEIDFYLALASSTGMKRVRDVLNFSTSAFSGIHASEKARRVSSFLERPGRQSKAPTETELALCAVARDNSLAHVLDAIERMQSEVGVRAIRPDLVYSVKATLRLADENPLLDLENVSWHVANQKRQKGRVIRNRSVGSTLLVKGLEFDHAVITPHACDTAVSWYVALTRATKTVRVLSPSKVLNLMLT